MARRPMISRYKLPRNMGEFVDALELFLKDQLDAGIDGNGCSQGYSLDVDLGDKVPVINVRVMDARNASAMEYPPANHPDETELYWLTEEEVSMVRQVRALRVCPESVIHVLAKQYKFHAEDPDDVTMTKVKSRDVEPDDDDDDDDFTDAEPEPEPVPSTPNYSLN